MEEQPKLLHDLFREQADANPYLPAVSDGEKTLSYAQLDEITDRFAAELQKRGACVDSSVVIYMSKSIDYVISYISILKAGAAYLPMDAAYPMEMVTMVLQDAQPKVVIVSAEYHKNVENSTASVVVLEEGWENSLPSLCDSKSMFNPPVMDLDSLAYVVYSSGTTGKPKGICCPHRGAVHSYLWRAREYPYGPPGTEREAANVFFVWELLRPLIGGQHLFVIPDNVIYDPVTLPQFIQKHKITRMLFTPSLLDAMLGGLEKTESNKGACDSELCSSLKLIILCGEVVTVVLRNKCRQMIPSAAIHNLYSISECHDVAGSDLTDDKSLDLTRTFCPVGSALPEVQIRILDESFRECPTGVQGEIFIGGPTLARGYLRRPDLNKERFIHFPSADETSPPIRMYRTGDSGYLVSGGNLEICGRCDSMVKVRGYSIELRAVQMAIIEHCDIVLDSLVVADGDAADTDKTLVAYLVCQASALESNGPGAVRKAIRAKLKKRLPFYMIPTYFAFLDVIPIHASSGKLDKKKLPSLKSIIASAVNDFAEDAPSTPTEKSLASLFLSVLSLPEDTELDATASFFDLGGHSLLTTPLLQGIEEKFGQAMSLHDLFKYPTVRSIADLVDSGDSARAAVEVLDLPAEVGLHYRGKDISMQLRAFWRHIDMESQNKTSRILLTGAAGFLGAFLLHQFLTTSHAYMLLIVRATTVASQQNLTPQQLCKARVWDNLVSNGLAEDTHEDDASSNTAIRMITRAEFDARVNVLVGDTSLGGLGLDSDDHAYLAHHVDVVVHAAAQVNLVYPYSALAGANVHGTAEIINFCTIGKVKPLHYISSNAVLPTTTANNKVFEESTDLSLISEQLSGGYAQSKWVAEQLVFSAMKGGLPAVVYRCGNLSGESKTAAWNKKDSNLHFMQSCIRSGAAPIFASDNETSLSFEMTPVDFAAALVVASVFNIRQAYQKTFHLIQPQESRCSVSDFLWLAQECGYEMHAVPLSDWVAGQSDELRKFTEAEVEELFGPGAPIGHRDVMEHIRVLHASGSLECDSYAVGDKARMRSYMKNLTNKGGLLPPVPRTNLTAPLGSRLVVVTGASSGIGECIARELVEAGAKVALIARREEKLKALVSELGKGASLALPIDVTDMKRVEEGIKTAEKHFEAPVWGLVNCAGVAQYQRVIDRDFRSWDEQININCKGVLNCVAAVLPSMEAYRRGHIVNITSDAGKKVFSGLAVYSATKHFVEAFAQGLRTELAPLGIKVTNVQPGDVKTELLLHTRDPSALAEFGPDEVGAEMLEPQDVSNAVIFALTQKSRCAVNEVLVEPMGCPI